MNFKLEIKSETAMEENNKVFCDEEMAVKEAMRNKRMVAYY